jgi:hypothetical protein
LSGLAFHIAGKGGMEWQREQDKPDKKVLHCPG